MRDFLENFPTENIELYDSNNTKIKDIKGLFGKKYLTITDISVPIIEGQIIVRKLPNGATEIYTIVESKFNKGNGNICSFYELSLQKNNINSSQNNKSNNIYIDNLINIGNNNKIDKSTIGNNN